MGNKLYDEASIRDIATAIREKNGTTSTYKVSEMGQAIRDITIGEGVTTPTGTIEIVTNGTHDVTNYANAFVNVLGSGGVSIGNWHTGSFTIDADEAGDTYRTVVHNLGFAPKYVIVWTDEWNDLTIYSGKATIGAHKLGGMQGHIRKNMDDTAVTYTAGSPIANITETSFDFGGLAETYKRPAGWTYRWFALA